MKFMIAKSINPIVCKNNYFFEKPCNLYFLRGGYSSDCIYGYNGPICGGCLSNFKRFGEGECLMCANKIQNIALFILFISLFLVMLLL